ncbi:MobH family relaxase [Pasteurella skyensis]|uniref:MobH family relaxase n=1 Tax=Phocoenobacter skyensis TaxID=97481 RepID=UPI00274E4988|nr:MobH family relaxase [Pasteurella skyensis]MDP8189047.1 MobH family relaxase [Pasteurella skyensis]
MFEKLLKAFKSKSELPHITPQDTSKALISADGWYIPLPANKLLDTPLRQQYLKTIWQNVSMPPDMFNKLYQEPIEKYAEMVQLLPASESHHHSHIGGMLDHGLEVISIATKLRQNYVLPQNTAPEEQAKQRDVWTAVIIYAALLHDIGKVVVDIEIQLKNGIRWFPWQGIPKEEYKFRYIKERDYNLHPVLGSLLANYLLPETALNWIASFNQAFTSLIYFISGHTDKAGILSEIIQKADKISVTMALGGDPTKLVDNPQISFAKQLHIALRHVVRNFKLNAQQGGSDGWLTNDGLWLMSKSTADNIRAYLISQGISVPSQNGRLFDELQAHNLIEKTEQGMAIWNGKPISNSGWSPAKPFTLLKVIPNIIWDNIEAYPPVFEGRLELENKISTTSNEINKTNSDSLIEFSPTIDTPPQITIKDDIQKTAPASEIIDTTPTLNKSEPIQNTESEFLEINGALAVNDSDKNLDFILDLFPISDGIKQNSSIDTSDENITPNTECKIQTQQIISDKSKKKERVSSPTLDNDDVINGEKFLLWLKTGIINGKLNYNRPNAKIHIVEDHLFLVTPSIFQIYLGEAGITDKPSWECLQKHFQSLGIHKRKHTENDSRNIWTCSVVGPNKKSILNGYLIDNPKDFFGNKLILNNQWLTLKGNLK